MCQHVFWGDLQPSAWLSWMSPRQKRRSSSTSIHNLYRLVGPWIVKKPTLKTHMAMAADAEAKSQEMPRAMWPSAAHWYDDVYFSFFCLSGYLLMQVRENSFPAFLQICCSAIAQFTTSVLNEEVHPRPYFTSESLFQPNFKLLLFYPNVTQPSVRRSQSLLQMAELLGVSDEHIHFGSKLPLCL